MDWLPRDELLTYEEIARIARVCVERFGFESIRLTGGEPTRAGPPHPARRAARAARRRPRADHQRREAARARARPRRRPGCGGSTSRSTRCGASAFLALTKRDELDRVLAGIDAALDAGPRPGEGQRGRDARRQRRRGRRPRRASGASKGVGVRFIEFMPLDAQGEWSRDKVVPAARDPRAHRRGVPARAAAMRATRTSSPRSASAYRDGVGDVGVIASVTEPFCEQLRPRAPHRRGPVPHLPVRARRDRPAGRCCAAARARRPDLDDRLAAAIDGAVGTKWAGHRIGQVDFIRPDRSMSQIGG